MVVYGIISKGEVVDLNVVLIALGKWTSVLAWGVISAQRRCQKIQRRNRVVELKWHVRFFRRRFGLYLINVK